MKLAVEIGRAGVKNRDWLAEWGSQADKLGVDMIFSSEAWWSDAATPLAFLAGRTERIQLVSGIMQTAARSPAMTAMTALTLHDLSGGRFVLGLGVSGPQVVEGLHGVPFAKPLTRLRETVDICRMIFRGEKAAYQGDIHRLPLPGGEGKSIRVEHEPAEIPIYLATLGPRALRYTGEAADGWVGTSFTPDSPDALLAPMRASAEAAGRRMDDINIVVACRVDVGENVEEMIEARKPSVAFQLGAMGSADTNFYNDAYCRAGYEEDAKAIQSLWVAGKRQEAADRVPDAMVTAFAAIGTPDMIRDRFETYRDVGVNTIRLSLDAAPEGPARLAALEQVVDLARAL